MDDDAKQEKQLALFRVVFVAALITSTLLIIRLAGNDISWWLIFAPITVPIIAFMIYAILATIITCCAMKVNELLRKDKENEEDED